ncbi:hypothetical protein [Jannaschia faecimaris]|uniref:hypothetical protein n=1 Tax=Jannaschia faecimaris TaxID=1244108 RepID=UPI000B8828AD|nr:hypothetical protein [Jannaschia faecimaris]
MEIGYLTGDDDHSWVATPGGVNVDVDGATFGLIYGRNWQSGASVFGYQGDLSASNADGFAVGGTHPESFSVKPAPMISMRWPRFARVMALRSRTD